jgi:actin-related protein
MKLMEERERQKKIVREFMKRWGERFELYSKHIEDFKIPRILINRNLNPMEFKKLWNELVKEVKKRKNSRDLMELQEYQRKRKFENYKIKIF